MKKPPVQPNDLILVTGGAGYIGSHLVRMLLAKGYRVRVLDTFLYGTSGLSACASDPRLELVYGDICNVRDLVRSAKGAKAVIDLQEELRTQALKMFSGFPYGGGSEPEPASERAAPKAKAPRKGRAKK